MPKIETKIIQEWLCNLGKSLGFVSVMEEKLFVNKKLYSPIYDVVWYVELNQHIDTTINEVLQENFYYNNKIPFCIFEIEGATTSSKNQVGNIANLLVAPSYLKFIVTNNKMTGNENDTWRRANKIFNTYHQFYQVNRFIVIDWHQLQKLELTTQKTPLFQDSKTKPTYNRQKFGGEKDNTLKVFQSLQEKLINSNLETIQNWTPFEISLAFKINKELAQYKPNKNEYNTLINFEEIQWLPTLKDKRKTKSAKDLYYIPKIDICAGKYLRKAFTQFLKGLNTSLGYIGAFFPILHTKYDLFFPILDFEIESSVNKHLNGGILNMSKFCYHGVLVSSKEGQKNLNFLKTNLGINNVSFWEIKE